MTEEPRSPTRDDGPPSRWRAVIAALANETARRVFAELTLGVRSTTLDALSPSRRRQVTQVLTQAGLVTVTDGGLATDNAVFADLLADAASPAKTEGLERFLDDQGRVAVYPASRQLRSGLFTMIARSALKPGEVLTEREVNARLSRYADDVAVLRRYLVDDGVLERTRSGAQYRRATPPEGRPDAEQRHGASGRSTSPDGGCGTE